jgi:uncharacterized protein YjbI with pentapeptide repeats
MSDETEEPQAGESKSPKIKAEDNPWYLLATLYGVPVDRNEELHSRNRIIWNRYFAANIDTQTRARLVKDNWHSRQELEPFSPGDLHEVELAFARRCVGRTRFLKLPESAADVDFHNVQFERHAFFDGYVFTGCSFRRISFASGANASFEGATFSRQTHFDGATFSGTASFHQSHHLQRTTFDYGTFSSLAIFSHAIFSILTTFTHAKFFNGKFAHASFDGDAYFDEATFSHQALFRGTTFSGEARFHRVKFLRASSFVNAKMKGETSFEGAVFEMEPPHFFGSKLHQGTVWRGIDWPTPKIAKEAGAFVDGYACLKLEMDRLKKHEDELHFFALELQSRRILLGPVRGLPIALYGRLSGFGRSYVRPLVALFVVAAIGAGAFWYFDARSFWEALGLSAANTLNVFGFRRDFNLSIDTPLAWL